MNVAKRALLLAATTIAVFAAPVASAVDYTYIEGGLIARHDYDTDKSGGRLAGSLGIPLTPLAIIAEYDGTGSLDQFSGGALFHVPLPPVLSLYAGATIEHAQTDAGTSTGLGGRIGVRWSVIGGLELDPELRYTHLFGEDQKSYRVNALFRIAPELDLQAALQGGEDRRAEIGARFNFPI